MADSKISALTSAATPLAGTEVLPVVQSGTTKQVAVSDLTAGRDVSMKDLTTTGNTILGDASTDTLNVGNGGLVKDASGNVGIGTASPASLLDVRSNTATTDTVERNLFLYRNTTGTAANGIGSGILLLTERASGGDVALGYIDAILTDATAVTSALTFSTRLSAGAVSERLRIDGAGSVGIGTSSPVSLLHVNNSGTGSSDHAYAYFTTGDTGATASDGLTIGYAASNTAVIANREDTALGISTGNSNILFSTNSAERLRIDSSGNLIQTVNTTAATLATNNTLTFSIVDNSTLRISVRGSDGTTRTATVALT